MHRDVLPHSACHKMHALIFSVPHAVLDDKMATAAILAVLMWKPDTRSFYLLSVGKEKQPLTFSLRDVLRSYSCSIAFKPSGTHVYMIIPVVCMFSYQITCALLQNIAYFKFLDWYPSFWGAIGFHSFQIWKSTCRDLNFAWNK